MATAISLMFHGLALGIFALVLSSSPHRSERLERPLGTVSPKLQVGGRWAVMGVRIVQSAPAEPGTGTATPSTEKPHRSVPPLPVRPHLRERRPLHRAEVAKGIDRRAEPRPATETLPATEQNLSSAAAPVSSTDPSETPSSTGTPVVSPSSGSVGKPVTSSDATGSGGSSPQGEGPATPLRTFDGSLVVRAPQPLYPRAARLRGQEGLCVLIAQVAGGRVTGLETRRSSGISVLDDSALQAVRHWIFRADVTGRFEIPIRFALRGVTVENTTETGEERVP